MSFNSSDSRIKLFQLLAETEWMIDRKKPLRKISYQRHAHLDNLTAKVYSAKLPAYYLRLCTNYKFFIIIVIVITVFTKYQNTQ